MIIQYNYALQIGFFFISQIIIYIFIEAIIIVVLNHSSKLKNGIKVIVISWVKPPVLKFTGQEILYQLIVGLKFLPR